MNAIVTQMIILFIIVIIGYFLSKKKMMDADFDRKLSVDGRGFRPQTICFSD